LRLPSFIQGIGYVDIDCSFNTVLTATRPAYWNLTRFFILLIHPASHVLSGASSNSCSKAV
jgi:hypothetical protein